MPKSGSTPVRGVPGPMNKPAGKGDMVGAKQDAPAKPPGGKQIEK